MGKHVRSIVIVVLIFIAVIFIVDKLVLNQTPAAKLSYSEFLRNVSENNIQKAVISGHDVAGDLKKPRRSGRRYEVHDDGRRYGRAVRSESRQARRGGDLR